MAMHVLVVAALAVTVQPAFDLGCRPSWNAGAAVIEAGSDAEARRVTVEMTDLQRSTAAVELDLPARSRKRLLVMPPLSGRVSVVLVEEDGTRTPLAYPTRSECGGPAIAALLRQDGRAGLSVPATSGSVALEAATISREDLAEWRPILSLDAIAAEARALSELGDEEREAIRRFVMSGRVLIVTPGLDPKPLFTSGWLPADLATNHSWASAPWGAGAVAMTTDLSDPRLGSLLLVTSQSRETWGRATSKLFEMQRDAAGPAGRAARPAGILALGAFLLVAALAHELLRRTTVPAREFDRYFRGTAVILGVTALSGLVAAIAGITAAAPPDLVLAHRSGWGVQSRAVALPPGRTKPIAHGAWPFVEPEVRMVLGARSALQNGAGAARVGLERLPVVIEAPQFDGNHMLVNAGSIAFDAGALVTPAGCFATDALPPGASVTATGACVESADLQGMQEVAWALTAPVYVARSGGVRYVITLETP